MNLVLEQEVMAGGKLVRLCQAEIGAQEMSDGAVAEPLASSFH